jgi:hypothetical protein
MGGGQFEVSLLPLDAPQSFGLEAAEFLVAGHLGSTPRPLAKVASGGELSRIALAIAVTTSQLGEAATLIFDEIDSGVGGAVADTVGRLMKQLAATARGAGCHPSAAGRGLCRSPRGSKARITTSEPMACAAKSVWPGRAHARRSAPHQLRSCAGDAGHGDRGSTGGSTGAARRSVDEYPRRSALPAPTNRARGRADHGHFWLSKSIAYTRSRTPAICVDNPRPN